jgi:hypothetical protein
MSSLRPVTFSMRRKTRAVPGSTSPVDAIAG